MRIFTVLFLAAASTAAAQSPARAARSAEHDKAAVTTLEHEWLAARDSATLDRILADDFRHPVMTGDVLSKQEHIAWVTKHPLPSALHSRFAALDVRTFGDAAIASGSVATTDSAGKEVARNVFTDVFMFRHGRWQAVSAQETAVTAHVTGPRAPNP